MSTAGDGWIVTPTLSRAASFTVGAGGGVVGCKQSLVWLTRGFWLIGVSRVAVLVGPWWRACYVGSCGRDSGWGGWEVSIAVPTKGGVHVRERGVLSVERVGSVGGDRELPRRRGMRMWTHQCVGVCGQAIVNCHVAGGRKDVMRWGARSAGAEFMCSEGRWRTHVKRGHGCFGGRRGLALCLGCDWETTGWPAIVEGAGDSSRRAELRIGGRD